MTSISRRSLISSVALGGAAVAVYSLVNAAPLIPTIVPAASPAASPVATPEVPREQYSGDLRAIWDEPWEVEGKLLSFKAVIIQRMIAGKGQEISVSNDEMRFRSLLHVDIPGEGSLFVASDDDLSSLEGVQTIAVEGVYGGMHGPGWLEPLIIATSIEPAGND